MVVSKPSQRCSQDTHMWQPINSQVSCTTHRTFIASPTVDAVVNLTSSGGLEGPASGPCDGSGRGTLMSGQRQLRSQSAASIQTA